MRTIVVAGQVMLLAAAIITAVCAGAFSAVPAPVYTITDIGTLGGSSACAKAINNSGVVTGNSTTIAATQHAFLFDGTMHDLNNKPGEVDSYGVGVNDYGQVAGYTLSYAPYSEQPFLYNPAGGGTTYMGFSPSGYSMSRGISSFGCVVGNFKQSDGRQRGFIWMPETEHGTTGVMYNLGVLSGGHDSYAYAVNDTGVVVGCSDPGNYNKKAVRWVPNEPNGSIYQIENLGTLDPTGNGYQSEARAVNNAGTIVGWSHTGSTINSSIHAFLYDGAMRDLGTLPGFDRSCANGININGAVVGYICYITGANQCGFIYKDGVMYDLNDCLDSTGSGWTIVNAYDINDFGKIAAQARNSAGQLRAVVLSPVAVSNPDTEPPVITSISLSSQLVAGGDTIVINVTAQDNGAVAAVTANGVDLTDQGNGLWTGSLSAVAALGQHEVTVEARDAESNAANSGSSYHTVQVVGINTRSLQDPIIALASDKFLFTVFGRVSVTDDSNFTLDDGGDHPVRVQLNSHGFTSGQFVRARGRLIGNDPLSFYIQGSSDHMLRLDQ